MIKWIGDQGHSAGKEQWSINATGTFIATAPGGRLTSDELWRRVRKAWMCLRFQHPGIASTADEQNLEYHVPDPTILGNWADETLHRLSDAGTTVGDFCANLGYSPYAVGYFFAATGQFLIHTSHWRTDGQGAFGLLNAFFEALAADMDPYTLSWGEEVNRLPPSIEETLDIPKQPTDAIRQATADCLASGRHVVGSVGLPFQDSSPGGTRSLRRTLSQPLTELITKACQARGLRLVSAVHASLATANFAESHGQGHYTSNIRFSLRPYLKAPYNGAEYSAALYTGSYMAKVEPGTLWQNIAAYYDRLYRDGLSPEFLIARRQFAVQALGMMQAGGPGGKRPPSRSEIDISSVDEAQILIAPVIQGRGADGLKVEVMDVALGLECQAKECYLFFWVFRGRIELNLVYNEAFYEEKLMNRALNIVTSTLGKELRIDE